MMQRLHCDPPRSRGTWLAGGPIYQIYVRSFADSDGDGVGDLAGISAHLDHCAWLGVEAIWLTPFFPSPMVDFGYDVSNYIDVDPLFGSIADFDTLLSEAHRRNIRVVLDLVLNHSSDRHPWFLDSRSSKASSRRDWYIWAPPKNGGEPNNWRSVTGGSAWTWDDDSGEFYLCSFLPCQPDLNWRNPDVKQALFDVVRFWLDRGADGFRLDMTEFILKDRLLRDDPVIDDFRLDPAKPWLTDWYGLQHVHSSNQPELHGILRELRRLVDSYDTGKVLIGELDLHWPVETRHRFYGDGDELHIPFNFDLIATEFSADALRRAIEAVLEATPPGAWPNWVLGNHDVPRVASRLGEAYAIAAACLLFTLPGTPFVYYGEELGLHDVPIPPERVQDPWERVTPGGGRDRERTPMPWSDGVHAGFSHTEPWLPVGDNSKRNVAAQRSDGNSMLWLYRRLIDLRRSRPALVSGSLEFIETQADALVYRRTHEHHSLIAAMNFSRQPQTVPFPDGASVLIEAGGARFESSTARLPPGSALIVSDR